MITFAREILYEIVEDVQPLLELHHREVNGADSPMELDPMWEKYALLEATDANALQIFTARDDGVLVGYGVFLVQPHLHHRRVFPAINDAFFVHPAHRGVAGLPLLRYCERQLKPFAQRIQFHVKPDSAMDRLLAHARTGYALDEHVRGKYL